MYSARDLGTPASSGDTSGVGRAYEGGLRPEECESEDLMSQQHVSVFSPSMLIGPPGPGLVW